MNNILTRSPLYFRHDLRGRVFLPTSKSLSARALLLAALCGGEVELRGLSDSDDTRLLHGALYGLRAKTLPQEDGVTIVDVGAAGTAMRFLAAYLAQCKGAFRLQGSQRMHQRPIAPLVDALRTLGAEIDYVGTEGCPPLLIRGRELQGGSLTIKANVSSQYISALLMIAPFLRGGLRLSLAGEIASRPYIDMTLALMRRFGCQAEWAAADTLTVSERRRSDGDKRLLMIGRDWSAASYWYELLALSPDANASLLLEGLTADGLQGDEKVAEMFLPLGVQTLATPEGVVLKKGEISPSPLHLDFSQQPDLAQTLIVTATLLNRPYHFTGLRSLRIKETDRLVALQTELRRLGYEPLFDLDHCEVTNHPRASAPTALSPASGEGIRIGTYDDHRMAMSFAPAALLFPGLTVENEPVVSKSFPTFWEELGQYLQAPE